MLSWWSQPIRSQHVSGGMAIINGFDHETMLEITNQTISDASPFMTLLQIPRARIYLSNNQTCQWKLHHFSMIFHVRLPAHHLVSWYVSFVFFQKWTTTNHHFQITKTEQGNHGLSMVFHIFLLVSPDLRLPSTMNHRLNGEPPAMSLPFGAQCFVAALTRHL